jgi:hypothetical protein
MTYRLSVGAGLFTNHFLVGNETNEREIWGTGFAQSSQIGRKSKRCELVGVLPRNSVASEFWLCNGVSKLVQMKNRPFIGNTRFLRKSNFSKPK